MTKIISESQMADKITQYFELQRTVLKSLIKSGDMPLAQYHILSMLAERGQMRMGEISDIMAISRPNLTPLVDKLVVSNYVARSEHDHDRRVTYICVTDAGRAALEKEHNVIIDGISDFTSKLSEEDCNAFIESLDVITDVFSKL